MKDFMWIVVRMVTLIPLGIFWTIVITIDWIVKCITQSLSIKTFGSGLYALVGLVWLFIGTMITFGVCSDEVKETKNEIIAGIKRRAREES